MVLLKIIKKCKGLKDKLSRNTDLRKCFTELEAIIIKYSELSFFQKNLLKAAKINDCINNFFKYPENEATLSVDYGKLIREISEVDIKEIKDDVAKFLAVVREIKNYIKE